MTTTDADDRATTVSLELRALERMATVLCEYVDQLARPLRVQSHPSSRETSLQLAVFAERRDAAVRALQYASPEPAEMRIARLQKVVEALDCSRAFFHASHVR